MNQRFDFGGLHPNRALAGALLIGIGLLALFTNLGLFIFGNLLGAALLGGLAYFVYAKGKRSGSLGLRLAALPLAGLALASLLPGGGGALFLALIGLAFALLWRHDQSRWWAVIPAGAFASLAATAALGSAFPRIAGFIFLLGLAATFFALTRLRTQRQPWAIYPAVALAAVALLAVTGGRGGGWLLPVGLLVAGVVVLARSGVTLKQPAAPAASGQGRAAEQPPVQPAQSDLVVAPEAPALPREAGDGAEEPHGF